MRYFSRIKSQQWKNRLYIIAFDRSNFFSKTILYLSQYINYANFVNVKYLPESRRSRTRRTKASDMEIGCHTTARLTIVLTTLQLIPPLSCVSSFEALRAVSSAARQIAVLTTQKSDVTLGSYKIQDSISHCLKIAWANETFVFHSFIKYTRPSEYTTRQRVYSLVSRKSRGKSAFKSYI